MFLDLGTLGWAFGTVFVLSVAIYVANRIQKWRRDVFAVAAAYAKWGLKKQAELCQMVGSNDVGGAFAMVHSDSRKLRDSENNPDTLILEWTKEHFIKVLPERLKDPELLALVQEALAAQAVKK